MDPITHALAATALDRAGLRRVSRMAMPILVVSGVAADLDLLSYFGGAEAYFHYHHTVLHSILGSTILAVVIAVIFWRIAQRKAKTPLRFSRVLLLCAVGAGVHILLDIATPDGVQLLWPFYGKWFTWNLLSGIDPWILGLLLAGLLLPSVFHLVSEEIGERKTKKRHSRGAIAALVIVAMYMGARAGLHASAIEILLEHDYHGATPIVAGAFPESSSPLFWRGLVDTTNTIEEVEVPAGAGNAFDENSSLTHYKPPSSAALEAARNAPLAKQFLRYARFPLANLENLADGYRVTFRDMRFPDDANTPANVTAVIGLDSHFAVRDEGIQFTNRKENPAR